MTVQLDVGEALTQSRDKVVQWVESLITSLPNVMAAFVVLLMFLLLARIARRVVARVLARFSQYPDINRLLATFTFLAVVAAGALLALSILNLDKTVTSLLAGAGIIGLAIGFAFQNIAENFVSGIILSIRREFTDGDIIETNDRFGTVEHIDLRATTIRTLQGQRVLIPNGLVFKNPLTNYTSTGARRVDLKVGVSYGDDLEKARRVALDAVRSIEERDPHRDVELFYEGFGDSSIDFTIRFWIPFRRQTDYLHARSEAVMRIKRAFDQNDVTIPFPIRTLDFAPVGGVVIGDAVPALGRG